MHFYMMGSALRVFLHLCFMNQAKSSKSAGVDEEASTTGGQKKLKNEAFKV